MPETPISIDRQLNLMSGPHRRFVLRRGRYWVYDFNGMKTGNNPQRAARYSGEQLLAFEAEWNAGPYKTNIGLSFRLSFVVIEVNPTGPIYATGSTGPISRNRRAGVN